MTEQEPEQEQWLPLTEAARILQIQQSKLSRLVKRGTIKSRKNVLDTRLTLVDMVELRKLFNR